MPQYSELVNSLRKNTPRCLDLTWRRTQLTNLLRLVDEQQNLIVEALHKDLRRPYMEAMVMEISVLKAEIVETLNELENWIKPVKVTKNLMTMLDSAYYQPQPLGVVLIIGAWNYPFQVALVPLIGAIAAGNCVVLKTSELSVHSSSLMQQLIRQYLDNDCIKVVLGGVPESTALLKEKFDHIFYTGSTAVGKVIYKAAAEHLTPVTLELGGKSPVVVSKDSDIRLVAKRVMWAKLANAGQTCISPDYVLVHKDKKDKLIEECIKAIKLYHSGDSKLTKDYSRIINKRHFDRLTALLKSSRGVVKHGSVETCDVQSLYIPPILLTDVTHDDAVMQEEIFGPILPFITVQNEDEALEIINSKPHPLVIYLFSNQSSTCEKFKLHSKSGSLVVNDLFLQMSLTSLPFGGVGESGMGAYHGKSTFDCFSHQRSYLIKKQNLEFINDIRYPPYTENKLKTVNWILKKSPKRNFILQRWPFILITSFVVYLVALLTSWV